MSTEFHLRVPARLFEAMVEQAGQERPNECCGLFAGTLTSAQDGQRVGTVTQRYPLVNALASPIRYESEPREMFEAMKDMRRRGIEVLSVYHSHPSSPPFPSRRDLECAYDPGVMNLIISLLTEPPIVHGWWFRGMHSEPATWEAIEDCG